ncbi:MAG: phosphoadenylyl-sulfate reductase [Anaerolineae bacterium]|nr:phosphoadenylyl-sulfate reductase [Anaerolineae bacterium]
MSQEFDLPHLNERFETETAAQIIAWAVQTFRPKVAMSCSFQTQSLPLLHIISQVAPDLPVMFVDTSYHFPETLVFRDQLVREWGLNLQIVRAAPPRGAAVQPPEPDLYRRNPDLCCFINKVEPMQQTTAGLRAWISGIRRDQSPTRAKSHILEQTSAGLLRVHPMANWTRQDVWQYIHDHSLPEHPLLSQGYLSIGCAPCTQPIFTGQDERAGRWAGQAKTECGLHTVLRGGMVDAPKETVDVENE